MATGAGKTFTAITAVYRLLEYGKTINRYLEKNTSVPLKDLFQTISMRREKLRINK